LGIVNAVGKDTALRGFPIDCGVDGRIVGRRNRQHAAVKIACAKCALQPLNLLFLRPGLYERRRLRRDNPQSGAGVEQLRRFLRSDCARACQKHAPFAQIEKNR